MRPITNEDLVKRIVDRPWYLRNATERVEMFAREFGRDVDALQRAQLGDLRDAAELLRSRGALLAQTTVDVPRLANAGKRALGLLRRTRSLLDEFERGPLRYSVPHGSILESAEESVRALLDFHLDRYKNHVKPQLQACMSCMDRFVFACKKRIQGGKRRG